MPSRSSTRSRKALALACAIVLVALVACSDNDKSATPTSTTTSSTIAESSGADDGVLTIGTLLPQTGALKDRGPSEFAGVDLAVREINEAGGVLGDDIDVVHGDSGDATTDIASETVAHLRKADVDAIVGPVSTAVTLKVIDQITRAGIIEVSPAEYADLLTKYDDHDLYFRTAAPNRLQASVLAHVIVDDGVHRVGIAASKDAYGDSVAKELTSALTSAGVTVVVTRSYDPAAATFDADARAIASADPEGVVVIGFEESTKVLEALIDSGVGPQQKKVYGTDGNMGEALGDGLPQGALSGMKGTTPLVDLSPEFRDRLLAVDSNLQAFDAAAESYDAVITIALAASAAKSDVGADIASEMIEVSRGGTRCRAFAECMSLLKAGTDFDYDGVSGAIDFDANGDPTSASFGILQFGPDGRLLTLEYRTGVADQ